MYKVFFENKAYKQLSKLSKVDTKRVSEKLQKINYPFPPNFDIDKISGETDYFRLRVGVVRIIFKVDYDGKRIIIREIKYRGQIYKN